MDLEFRQDACIARPRTSLAGAGRIVRITVFALACVTVSPSLQAAEARTPSDDEIAKEVVNALKRDPITESWEIIVSVSSGIVTLTGVADSNLERFQAEAVTRRVPGVDAIDNDIRVIVNPVVSPRS